MTVDELAAEVGVELFERACVTAWATASAAGRRTAPAWPEDESQVPHELSSMYDGDVALGFALYRVMPCYAVLMYVGFEPHDEVFWAEVRSLLDEPDDRLAVSVAYWLWCGPFEDAEVTEAWGRLIEAAPERRLRRLLGISGPVPWELKAPVLDRLAGRRDWDEPVLQALEGAAFDIFGRVDKPRAIDLLARLGLPAERTSAVREKLSGGRGRTGKKP